MVLSIFKCYWRVLIPLFIARRGKFLLGKAEDQGNTVCIGKDDNEILQEFNRRKYMNLDVSDL